MQWPELLIILSKQKGIELNQENIDNMTYEEKCKLLREGPVLAARQFEFRLHKVFSTVLMLPCWPLGVIDTYFSQIELQMCGSPHTQCHIWVENGLNVELLIMQQQKYWR